MTSAEKAAAAIRKTMAADLRKSEFLFGAHPELEEVRDELVRTEAAWGRAETPSVMLFNLAGHRLEALPELARLLFGGEVLDGLRTLVTSMEGPTVAYLLTKQAFDGFALLCKAKMDAADGPMYVNTLELVTTDEYSWHLTHFAGTEPIVFVDKVDNVLGSASTELLHRAVAATTRKLAENEASPAVKALRTFGFGTDEP